MIVLFKDKAPERKPEGERGSVGVRPLIGRASWRKARAIAEVDDGMMSEEDACARYGLSADELATWRRALQSFGFRTRRAPSSPDER